MKKGFTLVELLVVIGMLLVLMGAVTSSLMAARRRAKIAKATAFCQEMTNAFLALENYGVLSQAQSGDWQPATPGAAAVKLLLGEGAAANGGKIPVLFNATAFVDPWGRPYYYKVAPASFTIKDTAANIVNTAVAFPNYNRMKAGEVY